MTAKTPWGAILAIAVSCLPVRAFADPVTFVCTSAELTWTLDIDAAAGTAATMLASFTTQNIKWHNMRNGSDYDLDLTSGALQIDGAQTFTCHTNQKQALKSASN
jgi:hypothetical protein